MTKEQKKRLEEIREYADVNSDAANERLLLTLIDEQAADNQRLREFVLLVKATPDYGVGRCHHAITAEKLWAALEGKDELDNDWPMDRTCDDE